MTGFLVVIGLLVTGQVVKDRYGNPVSPPPGAAASESTSPAGNLLPLDGTSIDDQQGPEAPGNSATGNAAAGSAPTGGSPAANAGGNPFRRDLPASPTAPPRSLQNGAVSPPPGVGREQPSQLNGLPPRTEATTGAATGAAAASSTMKPSSMIQMMLAAPRSTEISGDKVTLVEVVAGATSRVEQTQRIEAYWDLCASVADYYLSLREQDELRQLRTMLPRVGMTWQQAEAEMAVRMSTSKRAAIASQWRLANLLGRGPGNLPLPADMPHCGSYHTRYDELFANRVSPEAQELAALLPLRHAELKDAAVAVTRGQEWLKTTASTDPGDGTATLRALEFLALRRRAFVQIVRDYNRRIARYTELSTPGEVGAERLVTMLIKRDGVPTATRPTVPTGATGRQSRKDADSPPSTFAAEGWETPENEQAATGRRDNAVEQTSGESRETPKGERSLLVQ
jgi:hypothetical protein